MSKVSKDMVPENFSLALSIVDSIPVLFFGINVILIGCMFKSVLFIIGAFLCFWAGFAKVLWKFIVALKKRNIWFLFIQMRIVMPIGFLLMILGVVFTKNASRLFINGFTSFPSIVFFIIGILGMVLMGICAFKLDNGQVKSNWIEQIINSISQISIFLGLIFLL